MTYLFDDKIRFDDSENLQAFGRLKIANARILGDYRFMYGSGTTFELDYVTSTGASIAINYTSVCAVLSVGTTSGSSAFMQTKQYHPYIPGTGYTGLMTFVFTTSVTGLSQAAGMFDDSNGAFFRVRDGVAEFVIRRAGLDREVVAQDNWNLDHLDGSMTEFNQSGITADWTKAQIFAVDTQWLGVGRVRFGFYIGGVLIPCHEILHANISDDVPYMYQPSLPLRWEIKNTAAQDTSHFMTSVCGAVYAEGGDIETGFIRSVSTGATSVPVTAANSVYGKGMLAVRLKNTVLGFKDLHALARLKAISVQTDQDVQFKVAVLPGTSALTTATWLPMPGLSWCEYAVNFTLNSSWATTAGILDDQFASGSANNKPGSPISDNVENRNNVIFQNYNSTDSQIFAVIGYRLTADALVRTALRWLEVK